MFRELRCRLLTFAMLNKIHILSIGIIVLLFLVAAALQHYEFICSAGKYGLINAPQYRYYLQSTFIPTYYYLSTDANNHVLFMFNNWQSTSALAHHFVITIWPNAGYGWATNIFDESLYVYTSFPSIAFAIPYVISHYILQLTSYQGFLVLWNLLLNLISSVLIYFIVLEFLNYRTDKKHSKYILIIALLTVIIYLFNANILHHSSMVYWAHELLQPIYLISLLFIAKWKDNIKLPILFVSCLLMSLITWTGYVVCFSIFLYYSTRYIVLKIKSRDVISGPIRKIRYNALVVVLAVISAICFTCLHYYSVIGFNYFQQLWDRLQARKSPEIISDELKNRIFSVFSIDYGVWILLLLVLTIILIVLCIRYIGGRDKNTGVNSLIPLNIGLIVISIIPCIETFLLLNHDIQYGFGRMKWVVPICLIFVYISYQILYKSKHPLIFITLLGFVVATCALIASIIYLQVFCGY